MAPPCATERCGFDYSLMISSKINDKGTAVQEVGAKRFADLLFRSDTSLGSAAVLSPICKNDLLQASTSATPSRFDILHGV